MRNRTRVRVALGKKFGCGAQGRRNSKIKKLALDTGRARADKILKFYTPIRDYITSIIHVNIRFWEILIYYVTTRNNY